ncbi:MAG: PcfB family protein [Lachnospiraceae bacterium]|nr:PcfB family protein [Lachnospiraceae bacterium]
MQEEVENKTVNLMISTTKLTARTLIAGFRKYSQHHAKVKAGKAVPRGKQSVKELVGQGQGVSSLDISTTGIRDFERIANKYGVDYAIKKDQSVTPSKYLVFFKARDADALTAAFDEYQAKRLNHRDEKPSVLAQLNKFKELVAALPKKVRENVQERDI